MEAFVQSAFEKFDILKQASALYATEHDETTFVGGFENYVYGMSQHGQFIIVRITHSSHRSENLLEAELDWISFLTKNGVNAAGVIPSLHGNVLEKLPAGEGYFLVTAFEKAKGRLMTVEELFNEEIIINWGQVIGRIHRITKKFVPQSKVARRNYWYEEPYLRLREIFPSREQSIIEIGETLINRLRKLPEDRDGFGLIHTDMHQGNFFVDGSHITVFDFDDCCYKWFLSDIAIALYYSSRRQQQLKDPNEYARFFMPKFMKGYSKENQLSEEWWQHLPAMLRLRDVTLYAAVMVKWNQTKLEQWQKKFMEQVRTRIIEQKPLISL